MDKFEAFITIITWTAGLILLISHAVGHPLISNTAPIALILWAMPAGFAAGHAIQELFDL